jgi:hypothetical protein
MKRPTWLMMLGLCCVLSMTAAGCRRGGGGDGDVAEIDPVPVASPTETAPAAQPPAVEPTAPEPTPTAAAPQAPEAPVQPEPPRRPQAAQGTAIDPPKSAQLIAAQPEARINLRSQPTAQSEAKGYGLVGDPVQLLRTTQGSDGYEWYYVKFEQSGAEGWVRGDFINTAGRATALPQRAVASSSCEGLLEALAFTAFYDPSGFNLIRFQNLETKSTFDASLAPQGANAQAQPVFSGSASPPTGGSYPVTVTDLSGGQPGGGSQVAVSYSGIAGTGTCN